MIPLLQERERGAFVAHVITSDFCYFTQRDLHGVHIPCSHRCVVQKMWAYAIPECLCFAHPVGFFNPNSSTVADRS